MRITIDRDQCISCGVCWSECQEIFEENSADGKSGITEKYRVSGDVASGEAPDSLRASAQAAADGCPVAIIGVE